jgi:carbamoyltransferase
MVTDPAGEAAALLQAGKVVGWFQGRAEIGRHALGNRSILADPRHKDMSDEVNQRLKRGESFRPFAPSVLEEHGDAWFDDYYPNPFMLLAQPVKPSRREKVPAITHVDGTATLQTVSRETAPLYYSLIERFHSLSGVPMVLNTNFNLDGEPMVQRPADAVDHYLRSGIDALFVGDHLAEKAPG